MSEKTRNLKHFNPRALLEKYSIGGRKVKKPNYSSFWMNDDWNTRNTSIFDDLDEDYVKPKTDHIALAGYRRAVSNFVNIVTGDPTIKVTFNSNDDSYTDGKTVVIGSKMDDKLFDSSVGLALHEGSHILLSDFDLIRNLEGNIPTEYFVRGELKGYSKREVLFHIKNLLNYVEDRRIDYHIFSTSPGYKGYYHSMYDKYFHAKVVDKALGTDEYTDENWDSYIFRILNMTNKNTNLRALKGLGEIYNLVFKANGGIKNLKNSYGAFEVALGIYDFILVNVPDGTEKINEETGEVTYEKADGGGEDESGEKKSGEGNGSSSDSSEKLSDEEFDSLIDSIENGSSGEGDSDGGTSIELPNVELPNESVSGKIVGMEVGKDTKKVELSERQKKLLEKAINKQKDFNNGEVKKTGKLTKKDAKAVATMEEAGVTNVKAGEGIKGDYDYKSDSYKTTGTKVILVKKLTKSMIEQEIFPSLLSNTGYSWRADRNQDNIKDGIILGTKLGKKLQVRGESRDTKWTRKDSGRIDKRLIAELGFGNDRVFQTTFVENYSDAFLHISVDASGSMGGDKWNKTMVSVVSICKAASMIQNVDVVVSFRTTHSGRNGRIRGTDYPLVLIAYDSRVDKFSKVKNLFPYIVYGGTTPEGLCFEAIMNEIVPASNDKESYFLNFSDGMPMFSNDEIRYYHDDAILHTKKMVDELRHRGISVLSYYIGDSYDRNDSLKDFRKMYGKDAEMIDVTNVVAVSKTMNAKFLER